MKKLGVYLVAFVMCFSVAFTTTGCFNKKTPQYTLQWTTPSEIAVEVKLGTAGVANGAKVNKDATLTVIATIVGQTDGGSMSLISCYGVGVSGATLTASNTEYTWTYKIAANTSLVFSLTTNHTFEVETAATCKDAGVEVCTMCGFTKPIAKTNNHNYEVETEATCAEVGEEICTICGHSKEIAKTNDHDFELDYSATCHSTGQERCTICDFTREIPKTNNHDFEGGFCTYCGMCETGDDFEEGHCTVCGFCEEYQTKDCHCQWWWEMTFVLTGIVGGMFDEYFVADAFGDDILLFVQAMFEFSKENAELLETVMSVECCENIAKLMAAALNDFLIPATAEEFIDEFAAFLWMVFEEELDCIDCIDCDYPDCACECHDVCDFCNSSDCVCSYISGYRYGLMDLLCREFSEFFTDPILENEQDIINALEITIRDNFFTVDFAFSNGDVSYAADIASYVKNALFAFLTDANTFEDELTTALIAVITNANNPKDIGPKA
ncbi:MAG: hypothetical protein FWD32_02590 [Firmicutes bacterium]|nr:hypothetical protein [Bacillota bacterium]